MRKYKEVEITLHNGPFALLADNRERVYKAMLNPIRSIRIYSHENPCSLKTRYKEKQDKLAKRDVLRSAGRAWITIVHLLLGKGEGEGAAGKGKGGKGKGKVGKGVGRLRRGKGEGEGKRKGRLERERGGGGWKGEK
jgi:hypothetical protein